MTWIKNVESWFYFRKAAQTFPEHPDEKSPKIPAEQIFSFWVFKMAAIPIRKKH